MASEIEQGLSQNSDSRKQGEATGLDNLIQGYSLYARTEGKSLKTISITVTALTRLKGFLRINGLSADVTQLSAHQIREFIQYLQQAPAFENHRYTKPQARGLSGHAINCYLRAIRAFWSWMVREEIIYSNPFAKVTIPKAPRKVIPAFSESQLQALLGAIDSSTPAGFRDSTMIMVLLDSGLRASELLGLTVTNLNLDDGVVKVNGKGGKERMVPIGARVRRMIWRYLQQYRPQPVNPRCDILFLSERGEPLSVNRLEAMIERCGQRAGIVGVRCSPHTFRHTFAITYLRNGGDVFTLQRILGHETLDMVRNYVNVAQNDVEQAHLRCSPADNMRLRASARRDYGRTDVQVAEAVDVRHVDVRLAKKSLGDLPVRPRKLKSTALKRGHADGTQRNRRQREKDGDHPALTPKANRVTGESNAIESKIKQPQEGPTDSVESQQEGALAAKVIELQETTKRLEAQGVQSDRTAVQLQSLQERWDMAEQAAKASRCPGCGNIVAWDRLPVDVYSETAFGLFNRRGKRCPICRYFEEAKSR